MITSNSLLRFSPNLILIWMVSLASVSAWAQPIQWPADQGGNNHWYEAVGTSLTWPDARLAAEGHSHLGVPGHLVTLTSAEENSFVGSQGLSGWTGGYQDTSAPGYSEPAGGWRWVTAEAWVFTNWYGS